MYAYSLLLEFNAGTPSSPAVNKTAGDSVRTLYACVGEHESELSFEPNQMIIGGKYEISQLYSISLNVTFLLLFSHNN